MSKDPTLTECKYYLIPTPHEQKTHTNKFKVKGLLDWGAWVGQSVECLILYFGSGEDPKVMG